MPPQVGCAEQGESESFEEAYPFAASLRNDRSCIRSIAALKAIAMQGTTVEWRDWAADRLRRSK